MTQKEIGKIVATARKKKNCSLLEIKIATGVQPFQVNSIENATANYTILSLLSICKYLGVELTANSN